MFQVGDERVDVSGGYVDVGDGGEAEALHQRLRAVVVGADGDAVLIQHRRQIVGMDGHGVSLIGVLGDGAATRKKSVFRVAAPWY